MSDDEKSRQKCRALPPPKPYVKSHSPSDHYGHRMRNNFLQVGCPLKVDLNGWIFQKSKFCDKILLFASATLLALFAVKEYYL